MDFVRNTGLVQWMLSGVLLGAGFVFSVLWPVGILGIAYFLYLTQKTRSYTQAALGGFVSWTVKSLAALLWFLSAYPIEWLTFSSGKSQLIIIILYWITTSVWLGFGGIVAALGMKKIYVLTTKKLLLVFLLPITWIGSELIGSLSFAVMTYGAGGAITSAFSFGYVGYLLAQHQWLLQLSVVYGVYGLSFTAVLLALWGLWAINYLKQKNRYLMVLIFCVFWISASVPFIQMNDNATEYYSVLTIDTMFPVEQVSTIEAKKEKDQELENAVQAALAFAPDYILLPEDTRYFDQTNLPAQEKSKFQFLNKNPDTIIVDTGRASVGDQTVLQSFIYNGKTNSVDQSHKRYLAPQGEFMPYLHTAILKLVGYDSLVASIEKDITYTVGPRTSQADAEVSTPGILFCFESVSPWGVKKIMEERDTVPFIAHPISHGWFNQPTLLWKNLDSMLRVQAVWNRQYIVSAGAQVAGQMVSPRGEIFSPENIASGENWTVRQSFVPVLQ